VSEVEECWYSETEDLEAVLWDLLVVYTHCLDWEVDMIVVEGEWSIAGIGLEGDIAVEMVEGPSGWLEVEGIGWVVLSWIEGFGIGYYTV
jgi:hypothetical protein